MKAMADITDDCKPLLAIELEAVQGAGGAGPRPPIPPDGNIIKEEAERRRQLERLRDAERANRRLFPE
jgi:hypothetical protein